VKIKGIDEEDIHEGFVLCDFADPVPKVLSFEAQIAVLDLLEHKPLLTAGYNAVFHCHTVAVECTITTLVGEVCHAFKVF
jgi:peptide chain release factor subunit 3